LWEQYSCRVLGSNVWERFPTATGSLPFVGAAFLPRFHCHAELVEASLSFQTPHRKELKEQLDVHEAASIFSDCSLLIAAPSPALSFSPLSITALVQLDLFDQVPEVGAKAWIAQVAVVFVDAK
jgi:hypothetical protein